MRSVSAREANQSFSRVLRDAQNGETVVVTRRGKPVAIVGPYRPSNDINREQAIERIVELMREGLPVGGRRFSRDEMHER
jgi:prevent-host-death family protein